MAKNTQWIKVGAIKTSSKGNDYLALGSPKSSYKPVNVKLVVEDMEGKVLATVLNPNLNVQNPRKRKDITEEQLSKIPSYLKAELTLPPDKE